MLSAARLEAPETSKWYWVFSVLGLSRRGARLEELRVRQRVAVLVLLVEDVGLAEPLGAHGLAVGLDLRAVGLVVEGGLGDARDDQRVDHPADQREGDQGAEPRHHQAGRAAYGVVHGDVTRCQG
ncbi:hypothetical protein GCM10020000_19970 [Streptomyces olivoverticillatus]